MDENEVIEQFSRGYAHEIVELIEFYGIEMVDKYIEDDRLEILEEVMYTQRKRERRQVMGETWKARLKRYGIGGLRAGGVFIVGAVVTDLSGNVAFGGLAAIAYKVIGKYLRDNIPALSWLPVL